MSDAIVSILPMLSEVRIVQRYPFRKALPGSVLLKFVYEDADMWSQLQDQLAAVRKAKRENQEGYAIENVASGKLVYVFFCDWTVTISTEVESGGL